MTMHIGAAVTTFTPAQDTAVMVRFCHSLSGTGGVSGSLEWIHPAAVEKRRRYRSLDGPTVVGEIDYIQRYDELRFQQESIIARSVNTDPPGHVQQRRFIPECKARRYGF